MIAPETCAECSAMDKLKLVLGVILLALSCLLPVLGFWIASLTLPLATKSLIIGLLTVGGPEILAVAAVSLLGKQTFDALSAKVLPLLGKLAPQGAVSRNRYTLGLILFVASFIPSFIVAYAAHLLTAHPADCMFAPAPIYCLSSAYSFWAANSGINCEPYSFTTRARSFQNDPKYVIVPGNADYQHRLVNRM
jgi:hypothetical protein